MATIPDWYTEGMKESYWYNPTTKEKADIYSSGYYPIYQDPNYSGWGFNEGYSPDNVGYAPPTPNYWWTGTQAVSGNTSPQEGWIPVNTTSSDLSLINSSVIQKYMTPPTYGNESYDAWKSGMESIYGISAGDAWSAHPPIPSPTQWNDLSPEDKEAILANLHQNPDQSLLPDGYHWEIDTTAMRWAMVKDQLDIDPGEEIDTSVADSVWEGMDFQINQWKKIFADALSKLDIDFGDQQTILDALTNQILNYEQPDLSKAYADMDRLIQAIEDAGTNPNIQGIMDKIAGGFEDEAWDFVARGFGFGTAQEYFDWQAEMRGLTRADMQGLTDQEKAEYDKIMRMDMADQERRSQAQMEAIFADTGSAIRYMAAADEANQQMVNMQSKYRADQLNQNVMLQSQELDRQMQQYLTMVQQGSMSASQYMDTRQRGYETILNGYLSEMATEVASLTAALEGVQGYVGIQQSEAQQDLEALDIQIKQVYNSMMAQSGINASILDALNQAYDTSMKPMMDAINSLLAQENLSAQDEQLAFQYQALAIEEMNSYLQFTVGMADAGAKLVDAMIPG